MSFNKHYQFPDNDLAHIRLFFGNSYFGQYFKCNPYYYMFVASVKKHKQLNLSY